MMKLVLFDIDGTLIRPLRVTDALQRFPFAIQKVFDIQIAQITDTFWKRSGYNGNCDRYILWDMVKHTINRDYFIDHLGDLEECFVEYLDSLDDGKPLYEKIPDASSLVDKVIASDSHVSGVLTGNLMYSANWKLHHAGYNRFSFGVYGHETDERNDLAKLALYKAGLYFNPDIQAKDIIIIGDTVHDIVCAQAIGAPVVIVSTGHGVSESEIKSLMPDLYCNSLNHPDVISFLGLRT